MTTITTSEILTSLAGYLASVALAQYNSDGSYLDHPDLPAILFADADTPDHCVVLTIVGTDPGLGDVDVALGFRATGVTPFAVESLADAVAEHFADAFDIETRAIWDKGTVVTMPLVTLPGGSTLVAVQQITRGTAELTSPAKHKGARFARTDTYRMTRPGVSGDSRSWEDLSYGTSEQVPRRASRASGAHGR